MQRIKEKKHEIVYADEGIFWQRLCFGKRCRVKSIRIKTVQEQIDSCPADRTDLLEEYRKRYDIMKEYAPKMLSKEEVTAIVKEKFADVIATKNKGQIMKTIMPELKGKADGKVINEVVTEMCNA